MKDSVHASDVVGGQQLAEDSAAILAATVAMEDGVIGFAEGAGAGGLLEGVADEAGFEVVCGGPADDAPGAEVEYTQPLKVAYHLKTHPPAE